MNSALSSKNKNFFLVDFLLGILLILIISGASFVFQGYLETLIQIKPIIHRLFLALLSLLALFLISFQWKYFPQSISSRCVHFLMEHSQFSLISLFVLLSGVWSLSAVLRHEIFHSSFDLAIFAQAIWNTSRGGLLYSSIKGGICLLGDHFSPLLILLAFPYRFFPEPSFLLILQATAAASAVFPIAAIANHKFKNNRYGLLFAIFYFFYLPNVNAVRFDFHPEMLTIPFVLWAFYFMENNQLKLASLFMIITLLSKENASLVTFGLGTYAFTQKKYAFGASWMLGSLLYLGMILNKVMPHFSEQSKFYLQGNYLAWSREGYSVLCHQLFSKTSFAYILKIFAPVGFLSFVNPAGILLFLPVLLQNLIARNDSIRSIFFHYTAFLTPLVFISAICGAAEVKNKKRLLAWLLVWNVALSGVSEWYVIQTALKQWPQNGAEMKAYFKSLDPVISVRTHEFFAPHLANRRHLYIYENTNPLEGNKKEALNADQVILDEKLLGGQPEIHFNLLKNSGYHLTKQIKTFRVYSKR